MHKQELDDQKLLSLYIEGDQKSFEILLERHRNKVYSYILMLVKDTTIAEDIFQDTFIKVIKTLQSGKYTEKGKFMPWVMRITHNLAIDHFRKSKKMPKYKNDNDDFDIFNILKVKERNMEDSMILDQTHNDVRQLIHKLPKEQKEVLYMRHYAKMSFNDIAEQSGVSINTALGRMRYALINLRKTIEAKNLKLADL